MKKELIAGIFLVVILISCIINIGYIGSLTDELILLVEDAENQASEENWDNATEKSENAMNLWDRNNTYLSVVLPNETIDAVTESLNELQKEIDAEESDSVLWVSQKAVIQLENVASMEQVNIESIF